MNIQKNVSLAEHTSFGTGGRSDIYAIAESTEDVQNILQSQPKPFWLLGQGSNSLISDKGLPGTTLNLRLNNIKLAETDLVIVESGAIWDELVKFSLDKELWGLELMSGIPGSVGAAIVGNIAAYGQSVSDSLEWIEVIDYSHDSPSTKRISSDQLELGYRTSVFSSPHYNNIIILSAAFKLSSTPTTELRYDSALRVATEISKDPGTLTHRREIIMEARLRAGSLQDRNHKQKTAGSFFKNPTVSKEQAEHVMQFEENSKITKAALKRQSAIHGGSETRISAALVILAAGFERGQTWGSVRLHPQHALKIENTGKATSQEIYDVAQEIISTVKEKLDITLVPEVKFMGEFEQRQ